LKTGKISPQRAREGAERTKRRTINF